MGAKNLDAHMVTLNHGDPVADGRPGDRARRIILLVAVSIRSKIANERAAGAEYADALVVVVGHGDPVARGGPGDALEAFLCSRAGQIQHKDKLAVVGVEYLNAGLERAAVKHGDPVSLGGVGNVVRLIEPFGLSGANKADLVG